jgi:hypothetical protein
MKHSSGFSVIITILLILSFSIPAVHADDSLVVTDSGNVGIGTTTPTATLQINSPANDTPSVANSNLYLRGSNQGYGVAFGTRLNYPGGVWLQGIVNDQPGDANLLLNTFGGNVGIGSANPQAKLEIDDVNIGLSTSDSANLRVSTNQAHAVDIGGYIGMGAINPAGSISVYGGIKGAIEQAGSFKGYLAFATRSNTNYATEKVRITSDGKVGIGIDDPQYKLHVVGGPIKVDSTSYSSDIRWKENVATIDNALDKVTQLRGVTYDWIDPSRGEGPQIGVIAQEMEKIFPEVVNTDSQGYKSVEYAKLVAPLIEAVKILKTEVNDLRSENEQLTSENQALQQTNQNIEARLAWIEQLLSAK